MPFKSFPDFLNFKLYDLFKVNVNNFASDCSPTYQEFEKNIHEIHSCPNT